MLRAALPTQYDDQVGKACTAQSELTFTMCANLKEIALDFNLP
jgi:hypothetical protein